MHLVTQSYLTLCDPKDSSPPGSSVHGGSSGKNTGVGGHALFQGIFPTQGSNSGLLHYWWILYLLSHWRNLYSAYKSAISVEHGRTSSFLLYLAPTWSGWKSGGSHVCWLMLIRLKQWQLLEHLALFLCDPTVCFLQVVASR